RKRRLGPDAHGLCRRNLSLVAVSQWNRDRRAATHIVKESMHTLQRAYVVEALLWKTGVHSHIRTEQTDVRATVAPSAVDPGVRHTKARFGFLNVGTCSASRRSWRRQRQRPVGLDERFEGVSYLKQFVARHAEEALERHHRGLHLA